jgi:catechol 2,3-dioxygenase-like lactoylglutathione lyase family enzyme
VPGVKGDAMSYTVSHFEIRVDDTAAMEKFYTEVLNFVVTDRGTLRGRELVFLSHSPEEHHQIVLIPNVEGLAHGVGIGHVAFRVDSLAEVRRVYGCVRDRPNARPEPVSHGNTWSVYFRDPEDNRIEIFTPTPWHTAQPCRFAVDYGLPEAELRAATESHARTLPGFAVREDWQQEFSRRFDAA